MQSKMKESDPILEVKNLSASTDNLKIATEVLSKWEQKLQAQEITVNVIQC